MSASEEMYRRIVDAVPEGIWVVSPEGRTLFCNDRMAEMMGTDVGSMQRLSCFDSVFPADLEEAQRHFGRQMAGGARPFDFRLRRIDGSTLWVSISCKPIYDSAGVSTGLLGLFTDISERRQSEAALQESEERFRNMADTAPVMIWVAGPDQLCTYFNKCCLNFTGQSIDAKIGDGWVGNIHPEDREWFLAKYSSSFGARHEFQASFRLRRADGEYRSVLTTGVPRFTPRGDFAGYIGSCVDITELRRSQDQALARQKLESVGVLAGGIAHDFNNLLGGILAEAELSTMELLQGESPLESIQRIRVAARRGSEIVRELMIYSGQDNGDPVEPVDLSGLVEEMLELLKVSISKHASVKYSLEHNLPAVLGRASQIRQIVMNLIINASEAIGDECGVIQVTTSRMIPPSNPDLNTQRLSPGDYLTLEVSDTGGGMTEAAQAKIFDPFFSTKFAGRGLGLAVVQGIVRDHGGAINLVSAPGQGTRFEIFLPCVAGTAPAAHCAVPGVSLEDHRSLQGTVLIVEDEGPLRLTVSKMLRKKGLDVIEAFDGLSALELVRAHKDEIDVMLLDVTLPGMSGREVFEHALRLHPDLRIILTSAYSREAVQASFAGLPVESFVRKPFQLAELLQLLRGALSKSTSRDAQSMDVLLRSVRH